MSAPAVASIGAARRLGPLRLRFRGRSLAVCCVLAAMLVALVLVALALGEYRVSPGAAIDVALGRGSFESSFVLETLRLPRILTALLVGGALGASGAVLQSLTRNPLGSPDMIGLTYGASAGAVAQIVVFGAGALAVAGGAAAGALLTALAMYLLTVRQGRIQGYRFVLVGIGIGAMMLALTDYLLDKARVEDAMQAAVWLNGSLADRGWEHVGALALVLAVLAPGLASLAPALRALELGDDSARALGVRIEVVRAGAGLIAVLLAAAATAAAGPIVFVALAGPQIARRLTRASGPGIVAGSLTGAALLMAADVFAQNALGRDLPVGLVTGVGGGGFLIWLLSRELGGRGR